MLFTNYFQIDKIKDTASAFTWNDLSEIALMIGF